MSLSGFINYLDVNNPNKHIRIIKVILMACCVVTTQIVSFRGTVFMKSMCYPCSLQFDSSIANLVIYIFVFYELN